MSNVVVNNIKKGDIVVCINDEYCQAELKAGDCYIIDKIHNSGINVNIIDKMGRLITNYGTFRFISIEQHREITIDTILE